MNVGNADDAMAQDPRLSELAMAVEQRCGVVVDMGKLSRVVGSLTQMLDCQQHSLARKIATADLRSRPMGNAMDLLVNRETFFFRERAHFSVLEAHARSERFRMQPLRVLSAGCSRGQETYSAAMALAPITDAYEVVGVDINIANLAHARRGVYSRRAMRRVPDHLREAYFEPVRSGYRLVESIRRKVRFEFLNLNETPYPTILGTFDVILFRNVCLYFSKDTAIRIVAALIEMLADEGILLLGAVELAKVSLPYRLMGEDSGTFVYRKGADAEDEVLYLPRPLVDIAPTGANPLTSAEIHEGRTMCEPAVEPRPSAQTETFDTTRVLRMIDKGQLEEATQLCAGALEEDSLLDEAHFLFGLVHKYRAELKSAEKALRRAIFLRPDSWPYHFFLGEVYRGQGKKTAACRCYANALNEMKKHEVEPEWYNFAGFSKSYFARTCESLMESLVESR